MNNKPQKENKVSKLLIFVLLFFIGWIIFNSCTVITYPNEYVIVKEFGAIKKITTEPGLSFKVPLIQTETSIPKDLRLYDLSASDVITSDKKTMIVDSYVLWRVTDPKKYIQTLSASSKNAEGRINTIVYNSTKNTISNMSQDEVIQSRDGKIDIVNIPIEELELNDIIVENTDNKETIKIKSLTEEIMSSIGESFTQYGINVDRVDVKMLDLPEANKSAVYTRMKSERENIAATYRAQGNSEAQIIKNTTDKEIEILLSEAEAQAESLKAEGEAEYMKILSEAYNDESKADFYTYVRSLDALKASMKGDNKTVILSKDSPIAEIFNLTN